MSDLDGRELAGLEYLDFEEGIEKSSQVDGEIGKVVGLMESILNSSPTLTWDDFYKIYTQWYELQCLIDDGINIGELKMFDAFCVATQKIMARPINCNDDTGHVISLILFIEDFRNNEHIESPLMEKFRLYLPENIPQEVIDNAQSVWKKEILGGKYPDSDYIALVFNNQDGEGYFLDLDYLRFFHERATDDTSVNGWYQKFKHHIIPSEFFLIKINRCSN